MYSLRVVSTLCSRQGAKNRLGNTFNGIFVNPEAARDNCGKAAQYQAYCEFVGQDQSTDAAHAVAEHFGIGSATLYGMASISFTAENFWFSFDVQVVDATTTIFLSMDNMDRLSSYHNSLDDILVHPQSVSNLLVTRHCEHQFIQRNPHTSCFFPIGKVDIGPDTRQIFQSIERSCNPLSDIRWKPSSIKVHSETWQEF